LAAVLLQRGNCSSDRRKMLDVELTVSARHNAGAKLDHRAARRTQPLLLLTLWILIFHGCYFIIDQRSDESYADLGGGSNSDNSISRELFIARGSETCESSCALVM
jgi:hypothetical protein